jgi:hypothetical protein
MIENAVTRHPCTAPTSSGHAPSTARPSGPPLAAACEPGADIEEPGGLLGTGAAGRLFCRDTGLLSCGQPAYDLARVRYVAFVGGTLVPLCGPLTQLAAPVGESFPLG